MTSALHRPARMLSKFLVLLALPLLAPPAFAQEMVSVSGKEVNMRSGPGTKYPANWALSRGYPLKVIGRQGDWLKVSDFENDSGWIFRSLTSSTPHFVVKAKDVNVRSEPTTKSRVVGKLNYGEVVKTLERKTSWVKIQHESRLQGWVSRPLLWGW